MVIKSYNIDFTFLPCKDINEMFHGYDFRVIQFYTTYKQLSEVVTQKLKLTWPPCKCAFRFVMWPISVYSDW